MKTRFFCFLIPLLLAFESCNDTKRELALFLEQNVTIPTHLMKKCYCSQFSDTTHQSQHIFFIYYIDTVGCSSCELSKMSAIEQLHYNQYKSDVEFIYVVSTPAEYVDEMNSVMNGYRLKNTVYLDTCNAFLTANAHIPVDNQLFHTFVINRDGKVLMVGNPFQNGRMEALFKKVIAKERRLQGK